MRSASSLITCIMARKEVSNSTLSRYQAQKSKDAGALESDPSQRPRYVQSVQSLPQAERWRQTIVTEISVKLTKINDPSIPELEIREINESLNKLHREKRAWEHHIKKLGGNDYITYGQGNGGVSRNGVRYFGRAKDLAEVKQMRLNGEANSDSLAKERKLLLIEYYGSENLHLPINTDERLLKEEVNAALGEAVLDAGIGKKQIMWPSSRDVERWLVEKKKRDLLALLQL